MAQTRRARANGDGSIYPVREGGKVVAYRAAYHVDLGDGRLKRRYIRRKDRDEVAAELVKKLDERERGLVFDAGNLTVGEYLDRWLDSSVRGSVRPNTHREQKRIADNHITPALGSMKLDSLGPANVQGLYRRKLDSGLSPASVHKIHEVLRKALSQAVRWRLVPRNAADDATPPPRESADVRPLSAAQTRDLLETARGDRLEALFVLAVHTGLRIGELLALRWEDVDLEPGEGRRPRLRVSRTLTREGGRYVPGEPKTPQSRRTVPLTTEAGKALRQHQTLQRKEKAGYADTHSNHDYPGLVFASRTGAPLNPSNVRNRGLNPLLERAGLPRIRFHDLRHTCATLLFGRGVHPKRVQEVLGHASIRITLDTYSHVLPGMGDAIADEIEAALS